MVMLLSAILVDRITWKRRWFISFLSSTSTNLHSLTFVTPSGTGSKTRLWSSRGIWEWQGRRRYWLEPGKDHQEHMGIVVIVVVDDPYRTCDGRWDVWVRQRWSSSQEEISGQLRENSDSGSSQAELQSTQMVSPSHSAGPWRVGWRDCTLMCRKYGLAPPALWCHYDVIMCYNGVQNFTYKALLITHQIRLV